MKSNNALIILWQGKELSDDDVHLVAEVLCRKGCIQSSNDITIVKKDENAIAKSLLATTVAETSFVVDDSKRFVNVHEEVENAIIYIGERFDASLKGTNTVTGLVTFTMNLTAAVTAARNNIDETTHDSALLNAISIIKKNCNSINYNSTLAKSHHFTKKVVEVICNVYNACM